MCQLCIEANEPMEPTDDKLIGSNSEEHVGFSTAHSVNPDQGTTNQESISSSELPSARPAISLTSIDSFASNYSDYSVDVSPNDGHNSDEGCLENVQDYPRKGLPNGHLSNSNSLNSIIAIESSDYLKEHSKEGKNGFVLGELGLRSASFKSTCEDDDNSSNDEAFDETKEPSSTFDDRDDIWTPPDAENEENNADHSMAALDDEDDEFVDSDGTQWAKPSSLNCHEDDVLVSYHFREEKQKAMEEVMNGKFKNLVSQLLKNLGVDFYDGDEGNWADIVTLLAWQAALYIRPDGTEAKAMDPAGYVKIKCIATGSSTESRLVKGLVFKKHAAHKHMATKYKNPRLLLIRGMLDGSSGSSGLSSFSSMITEDEGNLTALLEKLEACNPNVILVEKSANRHVVEGLLKLGATLVLDMKLHRLERVARCTGSSILSSDAIFGLKLSHCDSVYFEKYVEEHAIVGEGEKKPKKTLMFLEGCPKRLGCTILLKGSHSEELKKIKRVVLFAVVMAYHFILETSFLVDQKTMFSTFAFSPEADLSSAHEQSAPVVFEPVTAAYGEDSNGGSASAYEDQIPISNSDDDGSSHIQESIDKADKAASLQVHDIPISNRFHEEESLHAKEVTTKATETATSNGCHEKIMDSLMVDGLPSGSNEPHMPTLTRSLPSISDDMEKVSIGSSDAYLQMSAYVGLQERQIEIESVASAPVSPSDEAPDGSNIEAKGSIQDKPVHHHSRSLSSLSVIGEDAMKVFEDAANADGEDCIRPMDEISSVLDSESILVLMSSRNALKGTICEQSHFSHIKFYRNFDFPLGKFLLDNLFNQTRECKGCDEPPEAHFYYYAHHSKLLTIRVKRFGDDLQLPGESEGKIWMWSRCGKCEPSKKAATKRVLISTAARGLSFGKFLELSLSSHSCFNRLSSCGHSFQKDFLCFFGLGSTVAMFRYSRVARYKVSVPAQKLVFNSAIDREWLHGEIECVYTKGLLLFSEVGNYLKNIEPRFAGSDLVLNGSSKGFSDIEELLKSERSQFEENIKNIGLNNEESHNSVHKLLSLNQLRWDILLEASIWNQRLRFLLSFLSKLSRTASINGLLQRQMNLVEDRDAGGRTREPQTASEKVAQEQMIVDDHKVEEREEAKDEPLQGQTGLADNHDEGAVAEADVKAEGSAGLDDNSNVEIDQPQSTIDSIQPDETIEPVESTLHTKHNISETSSDGEVQVERVTEGDELSVNDSPSEEILRENGEQVLMKLPVAEESIQKPTVSDSEASVPSLKESLGSPNVPFEQLECNGESHQTNEISLPGNVLEGRSMPVAANGDDAIFSFERQPSQLPSPNSDDPRGWIWHPFAQVRERCMRDLRKEPIIDIIPALCQVVNEEGSRLHIPVSDDGYVVSDYDGEISSSVACALAMVKDRTLPSSNREENATLKRAASEPSPNLSLKSYNSEIFHSVPSMTSTSRFPSFDGLNRLDSMIDYERIHPEVTLGIDRYSLRGKYSVVIMYADQFRALRDLCCPSEIDYIASLSRCKIWDAKGGKSKSFFAKTLDDRLIIKEIKKIEFESFMKFAPNYFIHTIQSFQCGNQTCLAKILGIYQVTIRHANGRETKHDLMVQENLSFGRNISRQYDLKGALHARFTATSDGTGDVLLDQNFVNDMNSSPLYIGQRAKRLLQRAVWNDTTFLNSINVMDYSLLVGVDRERRELVCGIIDYLRQYTWDKQLETWVKSSLVVPKNVLPTIISPKEYKKRFRKFMDTHFLTVPDHWCSQRSSNPCKLCCIKAADESSIIKSSDKQEEEINGSYAYE